MEAKPSKRAPGARFSLLTLFPQTTIVALTITVAMLFRELGPLREEVNHLRNEVGELDFGEQAS